MPRGTSPKRERQYQHIKESYEERGQGRRAEEIAARTVNKERAEAGETQASRKSSGRSGAQAGKAGRSSKPGAARGGGKPSASRSSSSKPSASRGGERTREQLYEEARRKGVDGRSKMSKAQLQRAVGR